MSLRSPESRFPGPAGPETPETGCSPAHDPVAPRADALASVRTEQVYEELAEAASMRASFPAKNDHQCGCGTALDTLARMIADLQAHIDQAAAVAAAPRIGAALNRIADTEHQLNLARQDHDDLKRDTDRTIAALRRRTGRAEAMVVRAGVATHQRDDSLVPPEHRAAWNAGWQACEAAVRQALNAGHETSDPSPAAYERQVTDRQNPDYYG